MILYIIIGLAALVVIWFIAIYNGFIRLINKTKEAWSDIDVQLKRRHDLIPNVVRAVKGYAAHEKEAFENITTARSSAMNAETPAVKGPAEDGLAGALKSIFAIAEAYPDLKANQNFLDLQQKLADTEETIQSARRFYNGNIRELNIKVDSFPSNFVARTFNFTKMEFFQLNNETARNPSEVTF